MLRNLSDHDFGLSRSLKVKCDSAIGLPIYGFLLMFNSDIWPNSDPLRDISFQNIKIPILSHLRDISLQNLSDVDFDLSRSGRIKYDGAVGLSICDFLFVFHSKIYGLTPLLYDISK